MALGPHGPHGPHACISLIRPLLWCPSCQGMSAALSSLGANWPLIQETLQRSNAASRSSLAASRSAAAAAAAGGPTSSTAAKQEPAADDPGGSEAAGAAPIPAWPHGEAADRTGSGLASTGPNTTLTDVFDELVTSHMIAANARAVKRQCLGGF